MKNKISIIGICLVIISQIFISGCKITGDSDWGYGEGLGDWDIPTGGGGSGGGSSGGTGGTSRPYIALKASAENNQCAVVVGNYIYILKNDTQWVDVSPDTTFMLHEVVWNGSRFLAVGDNRMIATSVNGEEWTFYSGPNGQNISSVMWDGRQYLATASDNEKGKSILSSPDGVIWTVRYKFIGGLSLGKIVKLGEEYYTFTNGVGCAVQGVGDKSEYAAITLTSSNGWDWSSQLTNECMYYVKNAVIANNLLVGINNEGFYKSANGLNWEQLNYFNPGNTRWRYLLAWSGERFLSLHTGSLTSSIDGLKWMPIQVYYSSSHLDDLRWTGKRFIGLGLRTIITSKDGLTWSFTNLK